MGIWDFPCGNVAPWSHSRIPRYPWFSLVFPVFSCFPWFSLVFLGFPWSSLVFHVFLGFPCSPQFSMFSLFSMLSLVFPCPSWFSFPLLFHVCPDFPCSPWFSTPSLVFPSSPCFPCPSWFSMFSLVFPSPPWLFQALHFFPCSLGFPRPSRFSQPFLAPCAPPWSQTLRDRDRSQNSQTGSAGIYFILSLRLDSHPGIPTPDSWHFQTVIPDPKALSLVGIPGSRARPAPFPHFSPHPRSWHSFSHPPRNSQFSWTGIGSSNPGRRILRPFQL